jgi:hypothetical protein
MNTYLNQQYMIYGVLPNRRNAFVQVLIQVKQIMGYFMYHSHRLRIGLIFFVGFLYLNLHLIGDNSYAA